MKSPKRPNVFLPEKTVPDNGLRRKLNGRAEKPIVVSAIMPTFIIGDIFWSPNDKTYSDPYLI
jgi:hypothetical protein